MIRSIEPVLILQHLSTDGPAYLASWLRRQGVPFVVRNSQAGEAFPATLAGHSALAILGGEMSVNDPLPSLRRAEGLIREAMAKGKPVIGHCLGGQLMAHALGMRVMDSPAPEIGWQPLRLRPLAEARRWFGDRDGATVFHWHRESFELPRGAAWLAESDACPNQAFSIGPHLAMQFHIEVDADKIGLWTAEAFDEWTRARHDHPATVQGAAEIRGRIDAELPAHQALADRLYATWLEGVTGE